MGSRYYADSYVVDTFIVSIWLKTSIQNERMAWNDHSVFSGLIWIVRYFATFSFNSPTHSTSFTITTYPKCEFHYPTSSGQLGLLHGIHRRVFLRSIQHSVSFVCKLDINLFRFFYTIKIILIVLKRSGRRPLVGKNQNVGGWNKSKNMHNYLLLIVYKHWSSKIWSSINIACSLLRY